MRCTSCGSEITPGALICGACGAPVDSAQPSDPSEPAAPAEQEVPAEQPEPKTGQTVEPPPASAIPEITGPARSTSPNSPAGDRILGMPTGVAGNVALGLGGAGCLLTPFGCGWIFSILSLVVGILALKTAGRRNATIGLVLGGLGLALTLVAVCGVIAYLIFSVPSGNTTTY